MHVLVFVIGDEIHEQLRAQLRKHIDFYVIGGRWSDFLPKLRPDGTIEGVDSLRAGEIAWDQTLAEVETGARKAFAQWRDICERHGRPKARHEIARDLGLEIGRFGHYPEQVYAIYRNQPALDAYDELHPEDLRCPVTAFGFDEEAFVSDVVMARLTPFAMVIDKHWIEGPFGLDQPDPEWSAAVRDRLRSLDPETLVTVVDCHV
jgi:hypothetical protein